MTDPSSVVPDRVFYGVLDATGELQRLVKAGVLTPNNQAVIAATVAADAALRMRAGEPEPYRTDELAANVVAGAAQDLQAARLRAAGWLPLRPEIMQDMHGRSADYIAAIVSEQWKRDQADWQPRGV